MENASKALIMAGTILISVMVVSLGVYIINMFGEYTAGQEQERTNQQIAEFNAQFLKYEGRTDITAQDIVTVANLAKENNDLYELTVADASNNPEEQGSYYISVDIKSVSRDSGFQGNNRNSNENFENCTNKEYLLQITPLIQDPEDTTNPNAKILERYQCQIGHVIISDVTQRISKIVFTKIP